MQKTLLIGIMMIVALLGWALEGLAQENQGSYFLCRNHKNARTVRVEVVGSGGCKTIYTKSGIDRVVGSGVNYGSCINFLKNVTGNLAAAGWECRDISSSVSQVNPVE